MDCSFTRPNDKVPFTGQSVVRDKDEPTSLNIASDAIKIHKSTCRSSPRALFDGGPMILLAGDDDARCSMFYMFLHARCSMLFLVLTH